VNEPKSGPARAFRKLLPFWLGSFVLVNVLLILALHTAWSETVLHPVSWFFQARQGGDSWRPMGQALDHLALPEARKSLYDRMFFSARVKHKGFQYPPTSLLPLSAARALFGERWLDAIEWITWASVPALAFFVGAIHQHTAFDAAGGGAETGSPSRGSAIRWGLLVFAMTLTFYPAIRAYRNGQAQAWINTLFAAALWLWLRGRPVGAGVLAAVLCAIKPQYAIVGLWAALRGHRRFVAGWAAAGVALLGLSVGLYGVAPHLEYLRVLRYIARRGESFYPNQSVNGLLNRLLGNGDNATWMDAFPPPHPWVYAGTLISSALLIALALLWRPARTGTEGTADFLGIGLTCTLASPIAWEHHYGILLPIYAWLYPVLSDRPVLGRATVAVLALSYVVASNSFMAANRLAETPFNVLQSYLLAAGLLVLALLYAVRGTSFAQVHARTDVPA
jgi:hypothetical protein